jgi:predicted TIM-barrel fold metal-dependent hydrolase
MFIEGRYLTHPYYDPLWAELESLGMTAVVHPTAGLWNPEWTSHGPFMEKVKGRLNQQAFMSESGGGPFAGGGTGEGITFVASPPLGHPVAPVLSHWLDNHMFVASTLIGFTVMQRYPQMKVVVAHGKASWMEEVLEKMEASTKTIPLLHAYPVRTDPEEMWEEGHVLLGFDAEERLIQKLPHAFAEKIVWGSRYPHQDTTSAWDAIQSLTQAQVTEPTIARMLGGNAAEQFGVKLVQKVG